jgi:hypothetical protein
MVVALGGVETLGLHGRSSEIKVRGTLAGAHTACTAVTRISAFHKSTVSNMLRQMCSCQQRKSIGRHNQRQLITSTLHPYNNVQREDIGNALRVLVPAYPAS